MFDVVTGELAAAKLESAAQVKQVLKMEVAVLRRLQGLYCISRVKNPQPFPQLE